MEIARLVSFIQDRFGIKVPSGKMLPDHFMNISAISNLVVELSKEEGM
jgi:acyl carrier protein